MAAPPRAVRTGGFSLTPLWSHLSAVAAAISCTAKRPLVMVLLFVLPAVFALF